MENIGFFSFRGSWLVANEVRLDGGPRHAVEPVRIIPQDDVLALKEVVTRLLAEPLRDVPHPGRDSPELKRSVYEEATGTKSWKKFADSARCFQLGASDKQLSIEEWRRDGSSFVPPPLWRKTFASTDLGSLIDFLVRKTLNRGRTRAQHLP